MTKIRTYRAMSPERRESIKPVAEYWLAAIQARKRSRKNLGLGNGEIMIKVPKRLQGKRYPLVPTVYCRIDERHNRWSIVYCDLDKTERGLWRVLRYIREMKEVEGGGSA